MSLLESILALVIISAAVTIAAPSLVRMRENYELDAAARRIAANMQSTRMKAVARNRDCRLRVTSTVSYTIECEDPFWKPEDNIVLARGFRITANAAPQFHRRGNVSPAATVSVSDGHGRSKRVVVNIAGRVRVE